MKGVTIFRDGSRDGQSVLKIDKKDDNKAEKKLIDYLMDDTPETTTASTNGPIPKTMGTSS